MSRDGSCGPKGSSVNSTSLLFISLHVTEGGGRGVGCSRALCAATSGPSAVSFAASAAQILCAMSLSSNRLAEGMNPQVSTLSKADYSRDIS